MPWSSDSLHQCYPGPLGFLRVLSSPTRKLDHSRRQLKLLNRLRVERMGIESLEQDHTITLPLPKSHMSFQQPASSSGTVGGFLHCHLHTDRVACSTHHHPEDMGYLCLLHSPLTVGSQYQTEITYKLCMALGASFPCSQGWHRVIFPVPFQAVGNPGQTHASTFHGALPKTTLESQTDNAPERHEFTTEPSVGLSSECRNPRL